MIHLALLILSTIVAAFASIYVLVFGVIVVATPFVLVGLVVWGLLFLFAKLVSRLAGE